MRRLFLALSLTALAFGVVAGAGLTARADLSARSVNFGRVQAGDYYYATLTVKNTTGEAVNVAAPTVTDPFFMNGEWLCGTISAGSTCSSGFYFWTDWALANGTNKIIHSVALTGTGATTGNTYSGAVTFVATQYAQR